MFTGHLGGHMLVALIAVATALAGDVTKPVTIHNAGNGDLNILSTLSPYLGEEGQWTAVAFEAQHDLGVTSIDATFVRQPPGPTWVVDCVVDIPHDVVVFTSASPTPPADPEILYRTTIDPILGHPGGRAVAHLELPEEIFVPEGEHLFVGFELPGAYPAVTCLMISSDNADQPDDRETEFWSFATTAPFAWEGFDVLELTDKPVVSISGTFYL